MFAPIFRSGFQKPAGPMAYSGLGIAALAIVVVALLFAWIPLIGMLAVPVAGIGLVLGIIALVMARVNGGVGTGFPLAAILLGLCSIGVSYASTYAWQHRTGAPGTSSPTPTTWNRPDYGQPTGSSEHPLGPGPFAPPPMKERPKDEFTFPRPEAPEK
jgi:hypothetical protein